MKSVNTDVAYDFMRKRILSGEYPPGHPLLTEALAAVIGVSRTPIRDAIRKLEADGLVTVEPRLGACVKQMEIKEFRDLCDMRLALESHAAGMAAVNRTESDLQEIRFALETMRTLTARIIAAPREEPLLVELSLEDVRFHIAILTATKNDLMKKEILRFHLINRVVVAPPAAQHVVEKTETDARRLEVMAMHDRIHDAIARSEPDTAKSLMEFHIKEMIEHMLRMMTRAETGVIARELTPEELVYSAR